MQEKNEKLTTQLALMEKRVVTAETTLEATLQYESGQNKALSSPRYIITYLLAFSLLHAWYVVYHNEYAGTNAQVIVFLFSLRRCTGLLVLKLLFSYFLFDVV